MKLIVILELLRTFFKMIFYKIIFRERVKFKSFKIRIPESKFYLYDKSTLLFDGKISCRRNLFILNKGNIKIGRNVFFNNNCSISCLGEVEIGNDCLFGENVKIYDHDHKFELGKLTRELDYKIETIKIGKNCWIASNTTILRGSEIGDNVVVGAGAIVKGKIKDNSIYYNKYEKVEKSIGIDY